MTFKEFSEEAKRRGAPEVIEGDFGILDVLRGEGFSDEQIYEMKMEKVWKLYLDSMTIFYDQFFSAIGLALDKQPYAVLTIQPYLKELMEQLQKQIKELEDEEKRRKKNSS